MTDREYLELAAKAAGLTIHANNQASRDACGAGDVGLWISRESTCWNPLTDDGDALRLAVKLGLSVLPTPEDVEVLADQHAQELHGETVSPWACESWTLKQQDPYAATRRAIVRAAAEIGKGMK